MIQKSVFIVSLVFALGALAVYSPAPARAAGILYTVTSLADVADFSDGECTLREAIVSSNGGVITNCGPASSDVDEIEFAVSGIITLNSALPAINDTLTIGGSNNITISGNQAYRIFTVNGSKSLTLKDITLTEALTTDEGGAIRNFGTLYISNCKFIFNRSNAGGGAIYNFGVADISGSEFSYNISSTGGAIMNPGILGLSSTKFLVNLADVQSSGGAIWSSGPVIISASEFRQNKAGSGGAIHAKRIVDTTTLSIGSSLFEENLTLGEYPDANGGALLVNNLAATVATSTFSKNGGQSGGAIFVMPQGALTLTNSTLRDNSQTTNGAGLYNQGAAHLTNVTLSGNRADHGGGIDNFGTLFLTNVTLSGNQATYGGGLKNEGGTARLSNVTLANNAASAGQGGGIMNTNANTHLNLTNVIVADSSTGGNCAFGTAPDSSQFNLSSDNTCNFGGGRDNVNPQLGPLANNGGATQTHLPEYTSPAIDKGTDDDAPSIDQRAILRPQGTFYDVGAVEVECVKPVKPTLNSPPDDKTLKTARPLLKWNIANCAKTYTVMVKDALTGKKAFKRAGLGQLEYKTDPLPKGRTYKWFVKACNGAFGCAKSAVRSFAIR